MALPGFAKFFRALSNRHHHSAGRMVTFMLQHNAEPAFQGIRAPGATRFESPMEACQAALEEVSELHRAARQLYEAAERAGEVSYQDFVRTEVLPLLSAEEKAYSDLVVRLERAGPKLGLHIIDQELLNT